MNTIWLAFLAGLTTGGISCLAVQGGLLTSSLAAADSGTGDMGQETGNRGHGMGKWMHISIFLLAKLVAYMIVGYLLGLLGSTLTLSPKLLGTVQILVGLFMLGTAARLLDLHPIFRYFAFQPPKWVYKAAKRQSINASVFTPAFLGFLTILMPCGVTQATMAVAIASGNPLSGAAIMGAFVLGTSPVFFVLGASIVELLQRRSFAFIAAGVIAVFGVLSVNGGLGLRGSFYTIQNIYKAATTDVGSLSTAGSVAVVDANGFQEVRITVADSGYTASSSTLKVNVPVRVVLATSRTRGCARAFTVPDYGISKILPETGEEVVEFTPKKVGRLAYSCSMGMYTGEFVVIN